AQRERAGRHVQLTQEVRTQRNVIRPPGFVVVERPGQQVPQPELNQPGAGDEGRDSQQVAERDAAQAANGRDPRPSRRGPGPGCTDAHAQILRPDIPRHGRTLYPALSGLGWGRLTTAILRPDVGAARWYARSCAARRCGIPAALRRRSASLMALSERLGVPG